MLKSKTVRNVLLGSAAAVALVGATSTAQAVETNFGDVQIIFDTTVSMGASMRTADRETEFLPETNGGKIDPRGNPALGATGVAQGTLVSVVSFGGAPCATANFIATGVAACNGVNIYNNPYSNYDGTINADDARLNFDNGDLIGATIKANHDLQMKWQNYTVFARAVGFYDVVMNDHDVGARSELTDAALGDVGRNYELLDAFVSADYVIADLPVNLRAGKQVINWGESTFILNGLNIFNPIDVGAFRRPGSEIKEALVPVNALFGSVSLPFDVSIAAYYALDWEPFELDPSGTPFSGSDLVTLGGGAGSNQQLSFVTSSPFSGAKRNCSAANGTGTKFVQTNGLVNNPLLSAAGPDNNNLLECNDNPFVAYNTPWPTTQQERLRVAYAQTMNGDGISTDTSGFLTRGNDTFASDDGTYGLRVSYYADWLGGTEFGAYYQNYHSRLPIASVGVAAEGRAELGFFVNSDNTARNAGGLGGRQLAPAGCGLTNPALIGTIGVIDIDGVTPGVQPGAGLTMGGAIGTLGNPATVGTAAYQMANTPVDDPGNLLPTAAAAVAALSGGTFTMNNTNGFKNQLAVAQLNCALAYYQSGLVDYAGGGALTTTVQSFDGAEFVLGAGGGELFFTYPEDIEMFGASFNSTIWGWGVQGEFSYRRNAPFQVDGDSLTIAQLVNGCVFSQLYGAAGATVNGLATQDGSGFTPRCGAQRTVADGVLRNEMVTAQIGTTATFTASDWWVDALGADLGILVTEAGLVFVPDVETTWLDRYDVDGAYGPAGSTYRGAQYANTGCQGTDLPGAGILGLDVKNSAQCRPTDLSAGLVLLARIEYNNAFDTGWAIAPTLVYSYDFTGTTPAPYGNFMEDRQSLGLNVTGTLNNNLRIGASYSAFFGGHINNKSKDLDFASVSASYSF
jgi:hypothetical protein